MKAFITNFRGGKHTKYNNQMIGVVEGVTSKDKAASLIKKHVIWKSPAGKEIKGKINQTHGNKGAIRLVFEKGMPGQAIGTHVEVV